MPISTYITPQEGWVPFPMLVPPLPGQDACTFVNEREGMHLLASTRKWRVGDRERAVIHVSVGQILTFRPDLTERQLGEHIQASSPRILSDFFGGRDFIPLPADPRRPTVKHWMSLLEEA